MGQTWLKDEMHTGPACVGRAHVVVPSPVRIATQSNGRGMSVECKSCRRDPCQGVHSETRRTILQLGPSGEGWFAAYSQDDGPNCIDPVVTWALVRLVSTDVSCRTGLVVRRDVCRVVEGLVVADRYLESAEECSNFAGYVRKD